MRLAHITEDLEREQTILEHLEGTANLAGEFANSFDCFDWGYCCGLMHDIGKYSDEFQQRLHGGRIVDHASAGAKELYRKNLLLAYCIAGHHSGLLDVGTISDLDGKTFHARMKKELKDYDLYKREVQIPNSKNPSLQIYGQGGFTKFFLTRMLYSCLVDADYLDTERFMKDGNINRKEYDDIDALYDNLIKYTQKWLKNDDLTTINGRRTEILNACFMKGKEQQGLYRLSVPTGGGKTVSSLSFALEHMKTHKLDRVIYVIPYTSIIEQNAQIFKDILGSKNVLEDYYNVVYDDEMELNQKQLASENWDLPIITTTNVQFFESLFASKSSKCRKIHNISNSVIILDEAQMLPVDYMLPCLWVINELICNYHCSVVLSTATQPAFDLLFSNTKANINKKMFQFYQTEICPHHMEMYQFFKRTKVTYIGKINKSKLIEQIRDKKQVLCILNNKKQVQNIFEMLKNDGVFHLSTTMYPNHRKSVLNKIRARLKENKKCIVIATSLVESGVDLDFMNVYRELAGLDSILQAAGRCNREGKYGYEDSNTQVFEFADEDALQIPNSLKMPIKETKLILETYDDLTSLDAVYTYFKNYFHDKGGTLDKKKIIDRIEGCYRNLAFPFATIATEFKLIEEQNISIFIGREKEAENILEKLQVGVYSKNLMREAGRYIVNVYEKDFEALNGAGLLELLDTNLYLLLKKEQYDEDEGLLLNISRGDALFVEEGGIL